MAGRERSLQPALAPPAGQIKVSVGLGRDGKMQLS